MGKAVKDNINFNTVLLIAIGSLVTLGIKKADAAFTSITRLEVQQEDMSRRVTNLETAVGIIDGMTIHKKGIPQ